MRTWPPRYLLSLQPQFNGMERCGIQKKCTSSVQRGLHDASFPAFCISVGWGMGQGSFENLCAPGWGPKSEPAQPLLWLGSNKGQEKHIVQRKVLVYSNSGRRVG